MRWLEHLTRIKWMKVRKVIFQAFGHLEQNPLDGRGVEVRRIGRKPLETPLQTLESPGQGPQIVLKMKRLHTNLRQPQGRATRECRQPIEVAS